MQESALFDKTNISEEIILGWPGDIQDANWIFEPEGADVEDKVMKARLHLMSTFNNKETYPQLIQINPKS